MVVATRSGHPGSPEFCSGGRRDSARPGARKPVPKHNGLAHPGGRTAAWRLPGGAMPDQWMTYAQAGELLGLSAEAVRRQATRHGWRRQRGNDGRALVLITDQVSGLVRTRPPGQEPEQLPGRPPGQPDNAATVADLMAALVANRRAAEADAIEARRALEEQRERASRAEGEAAGLREGLRAAEEAAQRADEGRRVADVRAAEVQATADRERARATEAELRAIDAARRAAAAEAARRAFVTAPWWRRLMGWQ